jgi:hypothetical protein
MSRLHQLMLVCSRRTLARLNDINSQAYSSSQQADTSFAVYDANTWNAFNAVCFWFHAASPQERIATMHAMSSDLHVQCQTTNHSNA